MAYEDADQNGNGSLDSLPGLARIAATAWWHGAEWALRTGVKTGVKLMETAVDPRRAAELVRDTRGAARGLIMDLFRAAGLDQYESMASAADVAKKVADAVPLAPRENEVSENGAHAMNGNGSPRSLREEGEE